MINYVILTYITTIINNIGKVITTALAKIIGNISHDLLTGNLHKNWNGKILLWYCIQRIHPLTKGWLIIDDTWLEKTLSKIFDPVSRQFSGKYKVPLPGMTVVLLMWTDGVFRMPLAIRIWYKGWKTKPELALELLSEIRNKLDWKPLYVTFDAFYATKGILKRLDDYGWAYVSRIASNRHFEGAKVRKYKHQAYWTAVGKAWYGGKVKVIRRKDRFYICNRVSWSAETIINAYVGRVIIEETIRILKQELGFIGCQFTDDEAYSRHLYLCLIAFLVLEYTRITEFKDKTIYGIRQIVIFSDTLFYPPVFKRISKFA